MGVLLWAKATIIWKKRLVSYYYRFSIPLIISYLVSELYNMVDTYFVGNNVGGRGIGP